MRKSEEGPKGRGSVGIPPHFAALLSLPPEKWAGKFSHSLWKKLSGSLNCPLRWAVRGQCSQLLCSLALPLEAKLARSSVLCLTSGRVLTPPLCSAKIRFPDAVLGDGAVAAAQARSCSREREATPWPALAVLTLLKAALRKAESYWMSIKTLQWFKWATSMHRFVMLHPSFSG